MVVLLLSVLPVFLWVSVSAFDSAAPYIIGSRPLHFVDDPERESQVINSTLLLKKKGYILGPVYYNSKKPEEVIINNHHDSSAWNRPPFPVAEYNNNHNGIKGAYSYWKQKWDFISSTTPYPETTTENLNFETEIINNHKINTKPFLRPHQNPSSMVQIADPSPSKQIVTDVIGERIRHPQTIKSSSMKVLDAPSHMKTTIKHNKIIVIDKRTDSWNDISNNNPSNSIQSTGLKSNFSVAPVMDPWSSIPIPSPPSWAPNKIEAAYNPVHGGSSPTKGSPYPVKGGMSAFPVKGASSPISNPQTLSYVLLRKWMI